jgi:hypothetical protein
LLCQTVRARSYAGKVGHFGCRLNSIVQRIRMFPAAFPRLVMFGGGFWATNLFCTHARETLWTVWPLTFGLSGRRGSATLVGSFPAAVTK